MKPVINISEFQADHSNTERSTEQTVKKMSQLIRDSVNDPEVMRAAVDAVVDSNPRSQADICRCVWAWLKSHIRFVEDDAQLRSLLGREGELELLISPSVMVRPELLEQARGYREMQGDCDCFTMMGCAMLASLGVQPVIKTFKCDPETPWRWSHVCAGAFLQDGSFFPCDASHGKVAGWQVPPQHTFETAIWDMSGKRIGGETMRRGVGNYSRVPGWTGDTMTTVDPRFIGPYPSLDVMRVWSQGQRLKALQGIARAKYGMGICTNGFDEYDQPCTDFTPITSDPTATAAAIQYLYSNPSATNLPATMPGAGGAPQPINWASIIGSLTSAGTQLGKQALASPGTTILPSGAVVTGTPQRTSALSSSLSQYIPILAIGFVGILALSMLKK